MVCDRVQLKNIKCVCIYIGFVSNGEYNSMRVQGYTRPLSVLQIKSGARKKFLNTGKKTMIDMLTPIGTMYYFTLHACLV